jgi:pimeloyl-ACP methyl ester carboxylesterase
MNKKTGDLYSEDGARIHWSLIGSGPLMICSNGVGVGTFFWKYICENYANRFSVLLWDYRGHGKSDRNSELVLKDISIRRHAQDLEVIYNTLFPNQPPVILIGHSMGCQVALEFHRRNPHVATALVLMLGAAGKSLETFAESRFSKHIFHLIHRAINKVGPKTNRVTRALLKSRLAWPFTHKMALVDPYYTSRDDFAPYLTHIASMDILVFLAAAWECHLHNAWDSLEDIDIPTLIIAAESDAFFPISIMKKLHAMISHSEFLVLSGGSHAAIIEQPETINYRLDRFLAEHLDVASPHTQKQK